MYANPGVKLLSVDGSEPSDENIKKGKYPFVGDFYAATNGEPEGNTKNPIEWILSSQGQELVSKKGYTQLDRKKAADYMRAHKKMSS